MPESYDRISKLLHWLVVAFVLVQVATGLSWNQFGPETTQRYVFFRIHMISGIAILILMITRIAWRRTSPWRPLPQDAPSALKIAARTNHVLLYVALILQPLLGLLIVSPYGGGGSEGWDGTAHVALAWTIIVLVALHIAGALYHGFVRRDGVLQRMLPVALSGR